MSEIAECPFCGQTLLCGDLERGGCRKLKCPTCEAMLVYYWPRGEELRFVVQQQSR